MKRLTLVIILLSAIAGSASAEKIDIRSFHHAGPYKVLRPFVLDSLDVKGEKYDSSKIIGTNISDKALWQSPMTGALPECASDEIHLIGFNVETRSFAKADLTVKGLKEHRLSVDGKECKEGGISLEPGTHRFCIRFQGPADSLSLSIEATKGGPLTLREDGKRLFSLDINTQGDNCGKVSLSPEGRYAIVPHNCVLPDGKWSTYKEVVRLSDGKTVMRTGDRIEWMPRKDLLRYTRKNTEGTSIISVSPEGGEETVIAENIPEGSWEMSPDGSFLIYSLIKKGPTEGSVHQILEPDDRQSGWRDRYYLARYDIASGQMQDLTYGYHNTWLSDISDDGRFIIFQTSRSRLEQRPTTLHSFYRMDLQTLQTECLIEDDGFLGSAQLSPDGSKLLLKGSAAALEGIGRNLPEDRIPNEFDSQLFIMDIATREVTPLTREFDPSVNDAIWSKADGKIYFSAEDKDCVNLFRADPAKSVIESLKNSEDHVYGFDIAISSPALIYYGQSLGSATKVWTVDSKKGRQQVLRDFGPGRLDNVIMDEGHAYEFSSSRGDLTNCFYVLPPEFDPDKKYPMIVHYYGGCSPTSRYCIGSYSPQLYAAQGYVFLCVNPSGAAGFGQEFASRHVNTAGEGVAEDIIEATRRFCEDHSFVDSSRIGCFSASYGGFMTQLLLSKTDIYSTGISHAGISSHTSYWGEGYWGYSYSEVSMADSYPWTRKDLYVDRSPIYFADRIKTPLLFLHGSADTNVPIGESIQMFTALKLLGQDTAFVVVDGENHGISDYAKRRQWLRTISAWFAKYLKDDSSWWDELYPEKNL